MNTPNLPAVHSMTGYANRAAETPWGRLSIELKSVNSRFLEISFRTPDRLRALETHARECIAMAVKRGKLECRIAIGLAAESRGALALDHAQLADLAQALETVRATVPHSAPPSALELLRWPGVVVGEAMIPEEDPAPFHQAILELLAQVLCDFNDSRGREGAKMASAIEQQVQAMCSALGSLRSALPTTLAAQQHALEERLRAALVEVAPSVPLEQTLERVRQEVLTLGLRADITEECDRLASHLDEVLRVLSAGGALGKRLDFLAQEMNREANTIGSKSLALEQTRTAMALKLAIEQMREQSQNLE